MNNYYIFIGQPFDNYFHTHKFKQEKQSLLKIIPEHFCHLCFPPSDNTTIELENFVNWIQERGAISGSHTTEIIFEDILNTHLLLLQEEL